MFTGLCAFPLTPLKDENIDECAFINIMQRLAKSSVNSIGVLGSTGNYAYLSRQERDLIVKLAVEHSGKVPLIAGISGLRLRDVLLYAENAQRHGVEALLLAPMSYQKLSEREVFRLYEQVNKEISIPLCVYDNPSTTQFVFSDELMRDIAQLSHVQSIKIPPISLDLQAAQARINELRDTLPQDVTLGISGDGFATTGILAGCDAWYSVTAGLFPESMSKLFSLASNGSQQEADTLNRVYEPLWSLFNQYGSLRVIATAAEILGHTQSPCLPLPLMTLPAFDRDMLAKMLHLLRLD